MWLVYTCFIIIHWEGVMISTLLLGENPIKGCNKCICNARKEQRNIHACMYVCASGWVCVRVGVGARVCDQRIRYDWKGGGTYSSIGYSVFVARTRSRVLIPTFVKPIGLFIFAVQYPERLKRIGHPRCLHWNFTLSAVRPHTPQNLLHATVYFASNGSVSMCLNWDRTHLAVKLVQGRCRHHSPDFRIPKGPIITKMGYILLCVWNFLFLCLVLSFLCCWSIYYNIAFSKTRRNHIRSSEIVEI